MTPTDAARMAQLPSANSIYNFLNGHSKSLSSETYRRLSEALGTPISTLMGMGPTGSAEYGTVAVRAQAEAGVYRPSFELPLEDQFASPVLVKPELRAAGAYGVAVKGRGCDELYPEGSVLICVGLDYWDGTLRTGSRVVLQRIGGSRVEITVRELRVKSGRAWLWPRTTDAAALEPIEMPWPFPGRGWKQGADRFIISGVVLLSLVKEA